MPRAYQDYVNGMDAKRLDRLNVKYYVIPQLLPIDQASELYDVLNPYCALPYDVTHPIAVDDVVGDSGRILREPRVQSMARRCAGRQARSSDGGG